MADRGQIAFVFGVLELDFFLCQPVPIDRANQLLIFLQQSLPKFLCFFVVHLYPRSSKTLMVRYREMGVYAPFLPCQLTNLTKQRPEQVQHEKRQRTWCGIAPSKKHSIVSNHHTKVK